MEETLYPKTPQTNAVGIVKEVMTIKEFSETTDILPGTVRKLCANGTIPAKKLGKAWVVLARQAFGLEPVQINVYVKDDER